MAESQSPTPGDSQPEPSGEPGAPIPKDAIDPDLIKLKRARPKIGLLTSAGMVFLCAFFLWRLGADRTFGGEGERPRLVQLADVTAGKVEVDSFVELPAEPMMSHAIRATKAKGDPGLRVTPVRGANERVWLVLDGGGWDPPTTTGRYAGRLRVLAEMPFGDAVRDYAAANPRPVFVTASAVRAGFSANTVKTIDGNDVAVRDTDRVAFDVIDPNLSTVVATYTPGTPDHAPLLDAPAWRAELERLGVTGVETVAPDERDRALNQFRFDTQQPTAVVTDKLEAAKLWSARVEPVTRHYQATWGELKRSAPAGFTVGATTIPDAQLDLVGIYVTRTLPDHAYALIVGEVPQDYWYILPITIVVGVIGLLFLWALIRTVIRDFVPTRIPART